MARRLSASLVFLLVLTLSVIPYAASGSGFAIIEQGAKDIGAAFSGATADNTDPSAIFYNVAGISWLGQDELAVGGHLIAPSFKFEDDGSSYPLIGGMPISGSEGGDAGVNAFVPNVYYVHGVSDDLAVGIGLHAPFGLAVDYDSDWVGRYHALETELITLNINPSVAMKLTDKVSVGAGLSYQYAEATLSSAIDFGGFSGAPGAADGKAEITGDDWAFGFNLGVMVVPTESTRVGLSYRSKIDHTLEGDADFDVPAPVAAGLMPGLFVDTSGKADLNLPETAALGIYQRVGDAVAVMADVQWTGWSTFEELRVDYGGIQPDSVTEENWNDTMRYALGAEYYMDEVWTLRGGVAYDESPVPDKKHRTPRIPDANRTWLSVGVGYQPNADVSLNAGYTRLIFDDSEIEQVGATGDRLVGSYEGSVDIFSLQVGWKI
ncbi:MAG: outer membrane protein transport protein [Verrucomicrobia bacterium]|nr:outer membrane protein transport protein [Verrucomicrobiota bacterium]